MNQNKLFKLKRSEIPVVSRALGVHKWILASTRGDKKDIPKAEKLMEKMRKFWLTTG